MPCRLCAHRDSCKVYEKIRELEDVLTDSMPLTSYGLAITVLSSLEDEIARKCKDYKEVKP